MKLLRRPSRGKPTYIFIVSLRGGDSDSPNVHRSGVRLPQEALSLNTMPWRHWSNIRSRRFRSISPATSRVLDISALIMSQRGGASRSSDVKYGPVAAISITAKHNRVGLPSKSQQPFVHAIRLTFRTNYRGSLMAWSSLTGNVKCVLVLSVADERGQLPSPG